MKTAQPVIDNIRKKDFLSFSNMVTHIKNQYPKTSEKTDVDYWRLALLSELIKTNVSAYDIAVLNKMDCWVVQQEDPEMECFWQYFSDIACRVIVLKEQQPNIVKAFACSKNCIIDNNNLEWDKKFKEWFFSMDEEQVNKSYAYQNKIMYRESDTLTQLKSTVSDYIKLLTGNKKIKVNGATHHRLRALLEIKDHLTTVSNKQEEIAIDNRLIKSKIDKIRHYEPSEPEKTLLRKLSKILRICIKPLLAFHHLFYYKQEKQAREFESTITKLASHSSSEELTDLTASANKPILG